MAEVINLALISGLLLISSVVIFLLAIVRRRLNMIILSIGLFVGSGIAAAYAGYKFLNKSYHVAKEVLRPRSGEEVYVAMFGKSPYACSQVLQYKDQVVPKIDYAIWLHFKTCPEEVQRILKMRHYETDKGTPRDWSDTDDMVSDDWFRPEKMGIGTLSFEFFDEDGDGQHMYVSADSTEVYYMDVND